MKNNTKLRLHLWTEEKHKEKAIELYAISVFQIYAKERTAATGFKIPIDKKGLAKLSKEIYELHYDAFFTRTPSLSYEEIPKFINDSIAAADCENAISDFICLDSDMYKYLDINCKDLLKDGSIVICIDGIECDTFINDSLYRATQIIFMAINATDNSTKFRKDIKPKFRKHI